MTPRSLRSLLLAGLASAAVSSAALPVAHAQPEPDAPADAPAADAPAADAPAPAPAAPSPEDLEKAKNAFLEGKQLFDQEKFQEAVARFKESYRLSKNPLLLYNIGFTLDQLGDAQMALFYYEKFLADADETAANRDAASERVAALKGEAAGGDGTAGTGDAAGFQHVVVEEAPPGQPIDITATVPAGATWRVAVWYRTPGHSKFTRVDTVERYGEQVGRVPASATATSGGNVQYYIEVYDASGEVIERSGEPTSPHLVFLDPSAKARFYPDLDPTSTATTGATGAELSVSAGWTDVGSSKYETLKWGTTGGAVGLVLLSTSFYLLASSAAGDLEEQAIQSRQGGCDFGTPCRAFSDEQRSLQEKGERYEMLANVSLGIGLAAGIGAGVLWYLDLTDAGSSPSNDSLTAVPVVGDDFLGGAATFRF